MPTQAGQGKAFRKEKLGGEPRPRVSTCPRGSEPQGDDQRVSEGPRQQGRRGLWFKPGIHSRDFCLRKDPSLAFSKPALAGLSAGIWRGRETAGREIILEILSFENSFIFKRRIITPMAPRKDERDYPIQPAFGEHLGYTKPGKC